jgi:hypothetical protein
MNIYLVTIKQYMRKKHYFLNIPSSLTLGSRSEDVDERRSIFNPAAEGAENNSPIWNARTILTLEALLDLAAYAFEALSFRASFSWF